MYDRLYGMIFRRSFVSLDDAYTKILIMASTPKNHPILTEEQMQVLMEYAYAVYSEE